MGAPLALTQARVAARAEARLPCEATSMVRPEAERVREVSPEPEASIAGLWRR